MTQRTTELRRLNTPQKIKISSILNESDSWKKIMSSIPKQFDAKRHSMDGGLDLKKLTDEVGLKYTSQDIDILSMPRQGDSRNCAEIFIDEWSSSGKTNTRPTFGIFLQLLVEAELFAAADYIAELLCEPPPNRPLNGPGAFIDISLPSELLNEVASIANDSTFQPTTEEINENARTSNGITDNNQDYCIKYRYDKKNMDIVANGVPTPAPRTHRRTERLSRQEQSQSGQTVTATINGSMNGEREIQIEAITPDINDVRRSSELNEMKSTMQLPMLSVFLSSDKSDLVTTNTESTIIEDSRSIPMLSALQGTATVKNDDVMTDIENLPVISALNLNSINNSEHHENGICGSECDEDASNEISDDNDDDNDENSLRNLGSSNNDSSLTNVTGTSGENSFELSSSSTSNENIPLNVLQY